MVLISALPEPYGTCEYDPCKRIKGGNMKSLLVIGAVALVTVGITLMSFGPAAAETKDNPVVSMKTTYGDIAIELYPDKAPETVDNFLTYVDGKFYEGLIFHRVIPTFMIQGGGFTKEMARKEPNTSIKNEADNGLSNMRGTIAMARTGDPHSASSQFFINVKDNKALDFKSKSNGQTWGYCVFGKVIAGMDVVDEIRQVKTTSKDGYNDVPVEPVVITKVYRLGKDEIQAVKAKEETKKKKEKEKETE
jgi:cyclophilin family peptidyl-prolyl cis-trans isomerase